MSVGGLAGDGFVATEYFPREIRVPLFILAFADIEFVDQSIELQTPPVPNIIF